MAKKEKGKLFDKPQGPTERGWSSMGGNLDIIGTTSGVLCEACGTSYPELPENGNDSYTVGQLLEFQIVMNCCGAFIDKIYDDLVYDLVSQFFHDFNQEPLSSEFGYFRYQLKDAVEKWLKAANKEAAKAKKTKGRLPKKS